MLSFLKPEAIIKSYQLEASNWKLSLKVKPCLYLSLPHARIIVNTLIMIFPEKKNAKPLSWGFPALLSRYYTIPYTRSDVWGESSSIQLQEKQFHENILRNANGY